MDLGITLTEKQLKEIENRLQACDLEHFKIDISDEQLAGSSIRLHEDQVITIDFSEYDEARLNELVKQITREVFKEALPEVSDLLFKTFKSEVSSVLRRERKERASFEHNLRGKWGKALELLEAFLAISNDVGGEFNQEFREAAAQENDYVFEVLTRIHARACQITGEIIALLKSGYADGAHARWRTLHELSVVAYFVNKHGQDTAERYLLHDNIESYKAAMEYQKHSEWLVEEPPTDAELSHLRDVRDKLTTQYGQSFESQYGWAASVLKKENPRFSDIEKDVGLDHERPYYRLASHNVHANPKGIRFRLGLPPGQELLISGSSIFGLADPGQGAATALWRITTTLLLTKPNLDRLAMCQVLQGLQKEIGNAFIEAHRNLENRENH